LLEPRSSGPTWAIAEREREGGREGERENEREKQREREREERENLVIVLFQ
jgi:hypothetical protein